MAKSWWFHASVIALLLWGFGTDLAFGPRVAVLTARYKELTN